MKKLYLAYFTLLCCLSLTTTVYADVAVSPLGPNPIGWIVLIVVLPILAFILYAFLSNRKK